MSSPASVDTGGVTPWLLYNEGVAAGSGSGVLVANTVYLWAFTLRSIDMPITITGMRWKVTATATGTTDVGIYDSGGNLLTHTGAIANTANSTNSANFASALMLSPGRYYMACCPSNSTDTYSRAVLLMAGSNADTPSLTATNAGVAGVLQPTTGGTSASANQPVMSCILSGGLA